MWKQTVKGWLKTFLESSVDRYSTQWSRVTRNLSLCARFPRRAKTLDALARHHEMKRPRARLGYFDNANRQCDMPVPDLHVFEMCFTELTCNISEPALPAALLAAPPPAFELAEFRVPVIYFMTNMLAHLYRVARELVGHPILIG